MRQQTSWSLSAIVLTLVVLVLVIDVHSDNVERQSSMKDFLKNEVFSSKSSTAKADDDEQTFDQMIAEALEERKTFVDLYQDGVRSYLANDWETCVDELQQSLAGYRDYYEATASCRLECDFQRQRTAPTYPDDNVDQLHFYEAAVHKTLCLEKCKRVLLPKLKPYFFMDQWSRQMFKNRKPYEYLQLCQFRVS